MEEAVWQGARSDSGICQMVIIPMRPWGTSRRKAFICKLQHLRQIKKVHGLLVLLDKESAADTLLGGPHDHPTCRCMHIGALWVIAHQFAAVGAWNFRSFHLSYQIELIIDTINYSWIILSHLIYAVLRHSSALKRCVTGLSSWSAVVSAQLNNMAVDQEHTLLFREISNDHNFSVQLCVKSSRRESLTWLFSLIADLSLLLH